MRFLAVLTLRNEAAYLLDWLAHHRAVGFTDFLVLSNDCDDGTDLMLERLAEMGVLHHLRNDAPHEGGIQFAGLKRADKHPVVRDADWILALDIDEFVNIHVGAHQLNDLLTTLPEASAITLTWRLFGNDGVVNYVDRPVPDQFQMAAPVILHWPWRASMFKTLFRNDGTYKKLGVHRPRSPEKSRLDQARWFDGSGRELGEPFKRQKVFSPFGRDNYQHVQLNHYPLGAMQSYIVKADRGRAVHDGDADALGMSYWVERNWNLEKDTSIGRISGERDALRAEFTADPILNDLHRAAVHWRHQRCESLMTQERFRALFGRLLMTPGARALPLETAQSLYLYAQKDAANRN